MNVPPIDSVEDSSAESSIGNAKATPIPNPEPVFEEDEEELSSEHMLLWDRFYCWVNAILVVTFDIEMGQSVESIYPSHAKLTPIDKSNIAYLAFPDSNSGFLGDTQYHFRIKHDLNASSGLFAPKQANFKGSNDFLAQSSSHSRKSGSSLTGSSVFGNINYDEYNRKTLTALEV